ncbi:tryptophan synthase subunit alpha [Buchnera aphidicola]|uniref:Tryptophan synthase alpha chain n=1 Tax=Buchnera aphidicola (Therioaphis trifolii) TaxID=1241884 RepID=A0A4D6YB79_9GAMM|nr:tryptophan synthase subunit alpha [Buchnera aphidicola]QCI27187.1 tryptophan synthase subunit alpha [Buchnera aphidicola (Therioaphis trifolii)]
MNRYEIMFQKIKLINEGCFVPYITIGDPSIQSFYQIIDIFIKSGVNALELGIPFSDPLADGIIVQNANMRVLSNKITISKCFKILNTIRKKYPTIPIGILVYANIIFNKGIKNFYKKCKKIDIDSVLIPDLPIEESSIFEYYSKKYNILQIFICPPNSDKKLIKKIAKKSKGYVYLITHSGVTGLKNKINNPNLNIINQLKKYNSKPILQGFGISKIQHIKNSLSSGTQGVICGSIIIKLIEKYHYNNDIMLKKIKKLIFKLKSATIK